MAEDLPEALRTTPKEADSDSKSENLWDVAAATPLLSQRRPDVRK